MARPSSSSKTGSAELAGVIRDRRKQLGMSRQALAEATGVPYPTIAQIETAYRGVSPSRLGIIARVLGLDPKDLYDLLAGEAPRGATPPPGAGPSAGAGGSRAGSWHANPAYEAASVPPSILAAAATAAPPVPGLSPADPPPLLATSAAAPVGAPAAARPSISAFATPAVVEAGRPQTPPASPGTDAPPTPPASPDVVDQVMVLLSGLPAEERLEALNRVQRQVLTALVEEQVERFRSGDD